MDIYIDYETVCINCKAKGYSFGYSFKTIEYKGTIALDLPQRHLNGPLIMFDYQGVPILLHCLENSHLMGTETERPAFSMINAKRAQNNYVSKFTYQFSPELHPAFKGKKLGPQGYNPKIILYVDMYLYSDQPYILLFYSFRNRTMEPIENFKFFQLFDFDIYGREFYKTNAAKYDSKHTIIYQFDTKKGKDNSLFAGLGSLTSNPPTHFEGNIPQELVITQEHYRPHLLDIDEFGPNDCAIGLEWDIPSIYPDYLQVFPVMLVFGFGEKEFESNVLKARNHLQKLEPTIYNSVNDKFRQVIDPELEKLGFSMRQWCKDK